MRLAFFSISADPDYNPDADLDCDGAVNFVDLDIVKSFIFGVPGPSGPAGF